MGNSEKIASLRSDLDNVIEKFLGMSIMVLNQKVESQTLEEIDYIYEIKQCEKELNKGYVEYIKGLRMQESLLIQ